MTLESCLAEIRDPRRAQGQRISLSQLMSIIIISNLCGYFGGRPIATFAKSYSSTFTDVLGLRHPIPSHVTISSIINNIDQTELISAFKKWASPLVKSKGGDMFSGDGKALGSTVKNAQGKNQKFEAIVSIFCQKSGLIHSLERYENDKESEIDVVSFLIKELKGMGVTFYLDALHTQKNGG